MSDGIEVEQWPVEEVSFDATDKPPAGTECVRCRKYFGHFCPAKGYAGELPLCMACGAGERCEQAEAVLRMERGLQFDDMQVDERGLHGQCRSVAITEADRVLPDQVPSSAWTIKGSLDAANLVKMKRPRPGRIAVPAEHVRVKTAKQLNRERLDALARERRLAKEREAGRKRRMKELKQQGIVGDAAAVAAGATTLCTKVAGCDRPHGHSGRHRRPDGAGVKRAKPASAKEMKVRAVKDKHFVQASPVVEQPPELISVRMPGSAIDSLFAMLPLANKIAVVEKLMAELGGA